MSRWSTSSGATARAELRAGVGAELLEVLPVGAARVGGGVPLPVEMPDETRRWPAFTAPAAGRLARREPGLESPEARAAPARRAPDGAAPCRGSAARQLGQQAERDVGRLVVSRGRCARCTGPSAPSAVSSGSAGGSSPRARGTRRRGRPAGPRRPTPRSPRHPTSARRRTARPPARLEASARAWTARSRRCCGGSSRSGRTPPARGPGSCRSTRFCSPHLSCVWKPTTEKWLAARLSWRSCTTAYGRAAGARDRSGPPASWARSAGCRSRGWRSPRPAGSPRRRTRARRRAASRTPRWSAPGRRRGTPPRRAGS